jgi:RimJ/RimL family protein N-acetyltransferase
MSLLSLRPLALTDVDHMMTWVNDDEVVGNLAAFSGAPITREQEVTYVTQTLASTTDRVFVAERSSDGAYLGNVGIHQIHWRSRVGRLAIVIARREHHGQGYGSCAIARVLDWAFGEGQLHKVWLMVYRENTRSIRTYARLGFQEEGVLREEYFHEGRWRDMVRMGMLAGEWPSAFGATLLR